MLEEVFIEPIKVTPFEDFSGYSSDITNSITRRLDLSVWDFFSKDKISSLFKHSIEAGLDYERDKDISFEFFSYPLKNYRHLTAVKKDTFSYTLRYFFTEYSEFRDNKNSINISGLENNLLKNLYLDLSCKYIRWVLAHNQTKNLLCCYDSFEMPGPISWMTNTLSKLDDFKETYHLIYENHMNQLSEKK